MIYVKTNFTSSLNAPITAYLQTYHSNYFLLGFTVFQLLFAREVKP